MLSGSGRSCSRRELGGGAVAVVCSCGGDLCNLTTAGAGAGAGALASTATILYTLLAVYRAIL